MNKNFPQHIECRSRTSVDVLLGFMNGATANVNLGYFQNPPKYLN